MFFILTSLGSLALPNADAIEALEQAIERSQNKLEQQKKLKELLVEFNALKKMFVQEKSTKAEAWRMVKISKEMHTLIEDAYFESLFTPEFLEEIKVFSSFANKSSIVLRDTPP